MRTLWRMAPVAVSCVVLAFLALGCAQGRQPDTRAVDTAAIRQADSSWSTVAGAKNVDGQVAYYTDDAVVLAPNQAMMNGKEAIHKFIGEMFATPGFAIKWQSIKVEAARSGDFGYSIGTYELSMNDAKGKPMTDHGKYVTVWKKQPDGSWKAAIDMLNSDLPAAPSPPK